MKWQIFLFRGAVCSPGRRGPFGRWCPCLHRCPWNPPHVKVWSITQFFSVDFLPSRICVKNVFFTNSKSRLAAVVLGRVSGHPRLTWYPWQCQSFSVAMKATHEARTVQGPWRVLCQLKKTFKGPRQRQRSCWEERKGKVFPWHGVTLLLDRRSIDLSGARGKEGHFHYKNFLRASKWGVTWHTCSIIPKSQYCGLGLIPILSIGILGWWSRYGKWYLILKL